MSDRGPVPGTEEVVAALNALASSLSAASADRRRRFQEGRSPFATAACKRSNLPPPR